MLFLQMQTEAELDGGSQGMLLAIMLQRGAVLEVIAEGRLQIEAKLRDNGIFGTCRRLQRPLPGFVADGDAVHMGTHTLLQHHTAREVKPEVVCRPQLIGQAEGNAEVMQFLIIGSIRIERYAEL